MKKTLLPIAAVLALSACNSNDDVFNDISVLPDGAVGFRTYIPGNVNARGAVTTADNLSAFGVFANHDDNADYASGSKKPNFMYNQLVQLSGSDWLYDPIKYWPTTSTEKVSFFAYAPYVSTPPTRNPLISRLLQNCHPIMRVVTHTLPSRSVPTSLTISTYSMLML